jgi:hypothetical protein
MSPAFALERTPAPKLQKPSTGNLRIGEPNDAFEREADRVADEVLAGPEGRSPASLSRMGSSVQRKCACGGSGEGECEECKKKELRRKATGPAPHEAPPIVGDVLRSPGQPLDRGTRGFFESRFGYDFDKVRVHTGGTAAESAASVQARAYTVGHDLVFANSQYQPHSEAGRRLLSHELAHVVQQSGGSLGHARSAKTGPAKLSSGRRSVQRQCTPAPCPAVQIPLPSLPPTPKQAEVCLQELYAETHPNSKPGVSLGFNLGWTKLSGKDLAERQALTCLKGGTTAKAGVNYTAKHGMYAAQPDIWDFANRTMYEITTASQLGFKSGGTGKLAAQIQLANDITGEADCGGLMFSGGGWAPSPSPCCRLVSGLYINTVNVGGVLVYTPIKDGAVELTLAVLLATMATLLKKGGGAGGAAVAQGAKGVGGKALGPAYAISSMVAAAILLSSGRAEAKLGPGDEEPIVQLFKSLDQKGTPVPAEIQQAIEDDPELKAKVEAALKKGGNDPSKLQKELNDKILKTIADNPDQFSKEDLEKILTMTAISGKALPQGDLTTQQVRKLLDQKGGGAGQGSGEGEGGGKETKEGEKKKNIWEQAAHPEGETPKPEGQDKTQQPPAPTDEQKDKPAGPSVPAGGPEPPKPTIWDKAQYPGLSDESLKKILAAKPPVKSLWTALVVRGGEGTKVTDEITSKFFDIVPPDLTAEQAADLIAQVAPGDKTTADATLASLQTAVEKMKTKKLDEEAATAESDVVTIEPAKDPKKAAPQGDTDVVLKLAQLAAKGDFSSISAGELRLTWGKEEGGGINATLKTITKGGLRGAARVRGKILKREGQKITIRIVSSTPVVGAEGSILVPAATIVGNTSVYTLVGTK